MRRLLCILGPRKRQGKRETAAAIDWTKLPYFYSPIPHLILSTDGSWSGARVVDVGVFKPGPPAAAGFERVTRNFIWAPTCGRARERRSFTKTISVPGVPSNGSFNFAYGPGLDRPFEGAVMLVNGVEIARLPKAAGKGAQAVSFRAGPLSSRARRAFHYGLNRIVITATKARLKRGQRCRSRKVPRYVGILGDLDLDFAADLRVAPPVFAQEVVKHVTNGQVVGVVGQGLVGNAGPSATLRGTLRVSVTGDGQSAVGDQAGLPKAPFHDCTIDGGNLLCPFSDFRAGVTASFPFIVATRVNTGYFRNGSGRMDVIVSLSTPEHTLNNGDDFQQKVIVLCTDGATDPACA